MIEFKQGDIFDSGAQVLVNPVNCAGVSGKGLAQEFKRRWPDNQKIYEYYCRNKQLQPGELLLYRQREPAQLIFNVATKDHWRNPSELRWIFNCVYNIRHFAIMLEVKSVAVPELGCGNGGLDWKIVKTFIETAIVNIHDPEINYLIYEPINIKS